MQGEPQPWDRRPDEEQKDYEAFCEYLTIDPRPSGGRFAAITNGKYGQTRVTERRMAKFQWRERRAARDEREAKMVFEARAKTLVEAQSEITLTQYRDRLMKEASSLRDISIALQKKVQKYLSDLDIEDMTPSAAASMARAAKDLSATSVDMEAAVLGVSDLVDAQARMSQDLETSDSDGE